MQKVAIYCRLSEEDRDKSTKDEESKSIQNQKSILIDYAKQHGYTIYKIYSDDDYTGSDRNRPEFNELLNDAKSGKFEIVLCKTQSRFTREVELVEKYIHREFIEWGIRFIGVVDNVDTLDQQNKKSRQINALINEWYLEDLSQNIKAVFSDKRRKGEYIGAFPVYGYKKDLAIKGRLVIDRPASDVVKEIFTLYASGVSKKEIAQTLNDRKIENPTAYKMSKGEKIKSRGKSSNWSYSTIDAMLKNMMYIGNMVQGKQRKISYKSNKRVCVKKSEWVIVENTHEAIVDLKLWEKVQRIREQSRRKKG